MEMDRFMEEVTRVLALQPFSTDKGSLGFRVVRPQTFIALRDLCYFHKVRMNVQSTGILASCDDGTIWFQARRVSKQVRIVLSLLSALPVPTYPSQWS